MIVAYLSMRCRIVRFRRIENKRLRHLLAEAQSIIGIDRRIELLEAEGPVGPTLFGFIHTRLVLPYGLADDFTDEELRNVFLHECAHLRRHDLALNWLVGLLRAAHWFNPVLWWAFARMRCDRELACDDLVLRTTGEAKARACGDTIVRLLEHASKRPLLPGMVGIIESDKDIKQRITRIAGYRKATGWSVVAACLTLVLAHVTLTNAITDPRASKLKEPMRENRERQQEIWTQLESIARNDLNRGLLSAKHQSLSRELQELIRTERIFRQSAAHEHLRQGRLFFLTGVFTEAEAEYKEAARQDPLSPLVAGYVELIDWARKEQTKGSKGIDPQDRLNSALAQVERNNLKRFFGYRASLTPFLYSSFRHFASAPPPALKDQIARLEQQLELQRPLLESAMKEFERLKQTEPRSPNFSASINLVFKQKWQVEFLSLLLASRKAMRAQIKEFNEHSPSVLTLQESAASLRSRIQTWEYVFETMTAPGRRDFLRRWCEDRANVKGIDDNQAWVLQKYIRLLMQRAKTGRIYLSTHPKMRELDRALEKSTSGLSAEMTEPWDRYIADYNQSRKDLWRADKRLRNDDAGLELENPLTGMAFIADSEIAVVRLLCDGVICIDRRLWEEARSSFEIVQSIEPNSTIARHYLAELKKVVEQPEVRLESNKRAELLTFIRAGKAFYEQNQFDQAEAKFKEAFKLDPKSDVASYYRQLVSQAKYDQESRKRVDKNSEWGGEGKKAARPNPYYLTNDSKPFLTESREGVKRIEKMLDEIVILKVAFDGYPMSDVVEELIARTKRLDSEGKGIAFVLANGPPPIGKLKGAPLELPDPGVGAGPIADVVVNLATPLKNLKLRHVLDAVVKTADIPIRYFVEERAVVFEIGPVPAKVPQSSGKRQIERKLDEISFKEVFYPQIMLEDVIKDLSAVVKLHDVGGKGLNFMMAGTIPRQPSKRNAVPVLDAMGNVIPILAPSAVVPHQLRDVIIDIPLPLKNVKLRHVLDAIVKTADKPIRYVVEDYAIVFQPAEVIAKERLYSRVFKVDVSMLKQGLRAVTRAPGDLVFKDPPDVGITAMLPEYLAAAGAESFKRERSGRMLIVNEKQGTLMVRATSQELDIVSQAIELLNVKPPQIRLEVTGAWLNAITNQSGSGSKWFSSPVLNHLGSSGVDRTNEARGLAISDNPFGFRYANGVDVTKAAPLDVRFGDLPIRQRAVLSDPQYRTVGHAIEQRDGADTMRDRATITHGQFTRFWFSKGKSKRADLAAVKNPKEGVLVKCRANTTEVPGELRVDVRIYENKRAAKGEEAAKSFLFRAGSGSARFPSGNIFMMSFAEENYAFALFVKAALIQPDGTDLQKEINADTWVTSHPADFDIQVPTVK